MQFSWILTFFVRYFGAAKDLPGVRELFEQERKFSSSHILQLMATISKVSLVELNDTQVLPCFKNLTSYIPQPARAGTRIQISTYVESTHARWQGEHNLA